MAGHLGFRAADEPVCKFDGFKQFHSLILSQHLGHRFVHQFKGRYKIFGIQCSHIPIDAIDNAQCIRVLVCSNILA